MNVRRLTPLAVRLACGTPSGKPASASAGIGITSVGRRSETRLSECAQSAHLRAWTSPLLLNESVITSPVRRGRPASGRGA